MLNNFLYSFLNSKLFTIILSGIFKKILNIVFLKGVNAHPLGDELDLTITFTPKILQITAQYKLA